MLSKFVGFAGSRRLPGVVKTLHNSGLRRALSSQTAEMIDEAKSNGWMSHMRNIGISAHIDSGKTTLTERILYYTGRINAIHDVKGKDGVGAKMDSMDLEREKGITIQSAATFCEWKNGNFINIIDTPGHVDFTIEVERALRVLDGGILVLCGVSGVQSQSLTVDRQMKRYGVPRLAFVNKLDRMGANPWKVISQIREQLKLNAAAVQIPIGLEDNHEGVIDLVRMKAYYFQGPSGDTILEKDIPDDFIEQATDKRLEMIERLGNVDDEIGELFIMEEMPTEEQLKVAIRKATVSHKFVPVFMGSAFKNKGVQPLLDGVVDYLPSPSEVKNYALDTSKDEAKILLDCDPNAPFLGLAFKLEESRFGQLTYMRVYSGTLKKGQFIHNNNAGKRVKVPRLVKMHSNEMIDVDSAQAGDVVAMFGVDCASMDTFTENASSLSVTSMHVPEPVMSLSITSKSSMLSSNFSKALNRFCKEDPTFRVHIDPHSKQTIISGMGELHLEIYVERMKREYNLDVITGEPRVNFRETVKRKAQFNYLHKKQSGGQGQYARVIGYIEPLSEEFSSGSEFVNGIVGNAIPPEYIMACEKGMHDAFEKGTLTGNPVQGVRVVITDGQAHAVDSSELAFRTAMVAAFRQAAEKAQATVLEPTMVVEVECPVDHQGNVISALNRRKGLIQSSDTDETSCTIRCDVPLAMMFGFSTELRSATQGKGEFSMEYKSHTEVARDVREKMAADYRALKEKGEA